MECYGESHIEFRVPDFGSCLFATGFDPGRLGGKIVVGVR